MNLYDVLYELVDMTINKRTVFFNSVKFEKDSDIVIGEDYVDTGGNTVLPKFITDGILEVGMVIKLESDDSFFYSKIYSIDSESQITLDDKYEGDGGTGKGIYLNNYYPVIIGSQNRGVPSGKYVVIKEPPVTDKSYGQPCDDGLADETTGIRNTRIYRTATISLEEVRGTGDLLLSFERNIYLPEIIRYCKNNKLSVLKCDSMKNANAVLGGLIEKRVILDIYIEYPDEFEYFTGGIKDVKFTGKYDE